MLGDLLYADKTRARIPEGEWVGLVAAIAAGDAGALQALYERAHCITFTLIMRITNDHEIAEELTLEVFHDVWRHASSYEAAGGSVLGWILSQARARAIDRLLSEQDKSAAGVQRPAAVGDSKPPEYIRLQDAWKLLTPLEQQALEIALFSARSSVQPVLRLGEPWGTIESRIRSAVVKLRRALAGGVVDP